MGRRIALSSSPSAASYLTGRFVVGAVAAHGHGQGGGDGETHVGRGDGTADADADFLVRFLLRVFVFHVLPPEFLSGARASA